MKEQKFSVIKAGVINEIINNYSFELYDVVKSAYIAHHQKNVVNPNSCFLRFPDLPSARIIALPAAICQEKKVSGIKWIASNPDNIKNNLPRASAVILLNHYETGFPYACLEGAMISATRTVYSAILAAELLNPQKKAARIGVIGTGFIASQLIKWLVHFDWAVEELHLFDVSEGHAKKFSNTHEKGYFSNIKIHHDCEKVIRNSDLIIFTTTSTIPYVEEVSLFSHRPVVLHLSLRDLAPSIILSSHNLVDDVDHVLDAKTSLHLSYQTSGSKSFINATLGQLLTSECRIENNKPIIFSPMGMGMLDIALADFICQKAISSGQDMEISNFFTD